MAVPVVLIHRWSPPSLNLDLLKMPLFPNNLRHSTIRPRITKTPMRPVIATASQIDKSGARNSSAPQTGTPIAVTSQTLRCQTGLQRNQLQFLEASSASADAIKRPHN